jgi:hypothetical protein
LNTESEQRGARRWICLAGAGAVLLFGVLVFRYWNPVYGFTAFLQLDHSYDARKIAAFREQPVYVYPVLGPYDGIAYSQIAYHPLLDAAELRPAVDDLSYRARRILPSAVAWILAAGQPALIVQVYCCLNIAAWLVLAILLWRLLPVEDWRGAIAWAGVLFSAGALISVRDALTDLIALTILAAAMLALERGRRGRALGWLAAAALTRETSLAALPGFWTTPWRSRANLRGSVLAVLPLAAWLAYLRWRVGPGNAGVGNFDWPAFGFISKWRGTTAAMAQGDHSLAAWAALLALLGLTIQAVFMLRPAPGDPWWRIGAANTALLLVLGSAVWEGFPGAVQRVVLPLTLAFNVLACRRRAAVAWLIAGNLSVVAGLVALSDEPFDGRELLAVRHGAAACIVRAGNGWFAPERDRRHLWAWSSGDGRLEIEAWPRTARTLRLEFRLEAFTPRTVTIRENGRELWRGPVGRPLTAWMAVPVDTAAGLAQVEFTTDTPGAMEGDRPDARRLAFAIYDPKLLDGP